MLMDYLRANPIHFIADSLRVDAVVCDACREHGGGDHVNTLVWGPAGEFGQSYNTVADAVNYLLAVAAQLAGSGRPHAWDFAHFLTTWVMMATSGQSRLPVVDPRSMN